MIGLVSTGIWLPKGRETSEDISKASGIPVNIVEEKIGIIVCCICLLEIRKQKQLALLFVDVSSKMNWKTNGVIACLHSLVK